MGEDDGEKVGAKLTDVPDTSTNCCKTMVVESDGSALIKLLKILKVAADDDKEDVSTDIFGCRFVNEIIENSFVIVVIPAVANSRLFSRFCANNRLVEVGINVITPGDISICDIGTPEKRKKWGNNIKKQGERRGKKKIGKKGKKKKGKKEKREKRKIGT